MPTPDYERFEAYLKKFRPLLPDPLPLTGIGTEPRRHLGLATWTISALAMIVPVLLASHILHHREAGGPSNAALVAVHAPAQPFTIRNANALLATTPSYKAAMDELVFPQSPTIPHDKQSALAVLAKEKIKL